MQKINILKLIPGFRFPGSVIKIDTTGYKEYVWRHLRTTPTFSTDTSGLK